MEHIARIHHRWGNRLAVGILLVLLFLLPMLVVGLRHLRLETDVTTWLPEDDPDALVLGWFHQQFEHENRLLVSWDSSSLNDPRVREFKRALEGDLADRPRVEGIEQVMTPHDVLAEMLKHQVDAETAVERLTGILIGSGFLKVRLTRFGRENPEASRRRILAEAGRVLGREVRLLPPIAIHPSPLEIEGGEGNRDNGGSAPAEAVAEESPEPLIGLQIPEHDFQLRWPGIAPEAAETIRVREAILALNGDQAVAENVFFAPGAPVAISVSLDEKDQHLYPEIMEALRRSAVGVGIPEEEIRMGGSPVTQARLTRETVRAVWNPDYPVWNLYKKTPILLSAFVAVLVSFVVLRSIRLAILIMLTAGYTALAILVLVPATGKDLNVVLIVLPNLLLVLTISGAIHVGNYWKYAVSRNMEDPVAEAVGMGWKPCTLASLTTAIGMVSLLTAVLSPVREFGGYASFGCLISLAMILIVFPSLLRLWPQRRLGSLASDQSETRLWRSFGAFLARRRVAVSLACLALFLFSVTGLQWFRTETKVIRYFPEQTRIVQDYHFLEEGLAGIVSIETVICFDETARSEVSILERIEAVRDAQRRISGHPWVSGTLSLADFRPVMEPLPEDATTFQRIRRGRTAQRTARAIFEERAEVTRPFATINDTPISVDSGGHQIEVAEGDELWRIRAQASVLGDVDYRVLTDDLRQEVGGALAELPGTRYAVTGMVPLFLRTQYAVLESLIRSFGLAFCVIAVVMSITLRHPVSGLLAMLPNLFPVGVVFGLVSWAGVPVDIGTMITASVALGIAIDGTLHLLTWFQEGIREGLSRHDAVSKALGHCGPAMWQTSVSIACGIVLLAGADLLLISRFGILMASLIAMALVADVVLLPALLGGWLGRIIAKGVEADVRKKAAAKRPAASVSPQS